MPLRDGFFSTATQTSCCNRIQRSNRVRLLVVSTHDFPDSTKANGSHHGDNPLLRPTGIQIATESYATLQAMTPTNNKTANQNSFTPYREQPRSTRIVVAYPRPALSATNRTYTFQPVLISNSKFFKATHRTMIRKIEIPRSMVVEALSW